MRAHVIGNGPSWENFKKIEESDFVVGCNKPNIKVDACIIMDLRMFYKLLANTEPLILDCGIIINSKCKRAYDSKNRNKELINIKDIYDPPESFKALNSAHIAALWLVKNGYKEIHIWGCDSLSVYDTTSTTDIITKAEYYKFKGNTATIEIVDRWRSKWDLISNSFLWVNFIFHNKE